MFDKTFGHLTAWMLPVFLAGFLSARVDWFIPETQSDTHIAGSLSAADSKMDFRNERGEKSRRSRECCRVNEAYAERVHELQMPKIDHATELLAACASRSTAPKREEGLDQGGTTRNELDSAGNSAQPFWEAPMQTADGDIVISWEQAGVVGHDVQQQTTGIMGVIINADQSID